ncbi:MAG: flagellar hook-basal body complex protein FliE [Clostridia bacterium]|jgi:flagellar hook-basal body complex protein FliE|nr:flagellar hook-basal body complex protein FliE [Clostridia bacterium]MDD4571262.1 flagellar hook-basal body complex protein FliE [Clostridia bacterium]
MLITPIDTINSIGNLEKLSEKTTSLQETVAIPFQDMFTNAVNNVKATDAELNEEIYKLSTGQTDDLHNITIASAKASLSVDLLVELRNKALEAYKEIINMGV